MSALIPKKTSQQSIKEGNTRLIFNTLIEYQPISRAGIKKITRLSATTVSVLVEELIEEGLVEERGLTDTTEVGRKGILLALRPQGAYFLGVEITKTAIKSDLYDLAFNVQKSYIVEFSGANELTLKLLAMVEKVKNFVGGKLCGISIGVPAMVDDKEQRVLASTVLDFIPDRDLVKIIGKVSPLSTICLYNNSGFVAYSEKELHKNVRNILSVDIGDGVGAGLVIDGELFTGSHGLAGEFGHMSVDYNGKVCRCGSRGCLEGLVSVKAVTEQISEKVGKADLSLSDCVKLLDADNEQARLVIRETARILSYAINSVINLFDPELVVINGEIKEFGEHLLAPLKEFLDKKNLRNRQIVVELSRMRGNSVTFGGAHFAFRNYFNKED